jgi:hypothetical protein
MTPTAEQMRRLARDWRQFAGNTIKRIEFRSGTFYAFGSELGMLRLHYVYRGTPSRARAFKSPSADTWVFALETDL